MVEEEGVIHVRLCSISVAPFLHCKAPVCGFGCFCIAVPSPALTPKMGGIVLFVWLLASYRSLSWRLGLSRSSIANTLTVFWFRGCCILSGVLFDLRERNTWVRAFYIPSGYQCLGGYAWLFELSVAVRQKQGLMYT